MNLNRTLIQLQTVTGYPVEQDSYEGEKEKYIVFAYETERPQIHGDNRPMADTCWMQVSLYTPKSYNYMADKEKIRAWLEKNGFCVTGISSRLENIVVGTQRIRRTTFEVNITEERGREKEGE